MYKRNNPLNIRYSAANNWRGQVGSENGFCVFDDYINGFRAAIITIRSYYYRRNLRTISDIISRFAPATENNTSGYISYICGKTGYAPKQTIAFNKDIICTLIYYMCIMESGKTPSIDDIRGAYNLI